MIRIADKEITAINARGRVVTAVYAGARLVWTALSALFGSRFWTHGKRWRHGEFWLTK